MARSKRQPPPREFGVYINFEKIFHQGARAGDMELYFSQMPRDRALKVLCGLSTLVYNFKGSSYFAFQQGVVRELSDGNAYAQRIVEDLVDPNIFINAEQLAVLQKFAILHCAPDGTASPSDFNDLLLRAMLSYNSLRGREDLDRSDKQAAFLTVELRNMFNAEDLTGFLVNLYWQFFRWAKTAEARSLCDYLDINSDFKEFYGVSYEEYAAAAFVFLAHYLGIKSVADFYTRSPFVDIDRYLQNLTAQDSVRKWIEFNSLSLSEAKRAFEQPSELQYSGFSLQALISRPLVIAEESVAFCPHLPFLENKIGTGVFFALLDGYNKADGDQVRSNRFTRFFGNFFEKHCVALAKETYPDPSVVFEEQEYSGGKSTDLVIFEGESAVFIDIAAARLTMKKTIVDLNEASIVNDVDKILGNAKQMTRTISDFREGRLVYRTPDGTRIDQSAIKKIYPVALIIAPIPRFWAFNNVIYKRLEEKRYLQDTEPFDILSARDFDLLMRLVRAGYKISEVLQRKLTYALPFARRGSLWNFVGIYDKELWEKANAVEWPGLRDAWLDEVTATVRSWGLAV